ncbi:MAG: LysR family transcriptional regulator [Myxococcales bacterium]|nr:LysR family transcriptional regulator [Myxococcales bacterium]MCB9534443.1 LysR family transcriptional regulator [Myxococcales bacterium]MCB9625634.1 LysR family transcriptional regulator [Sandaracinus sp.]
MDLNALKLFVAAAQVGSLSEAARRTGVPLATLSRRIRALEEELSSRLLERSTQGLSLTDAGLRLFASAEPALALLEQAEHGARGESEMSGRVRVSLPPQFRPVLRAVEAFTQRNPAVRFDVFVTDRRVDLVADGIDVAIRVGEGGRSSYVGRTLARYRHRLVAAPALLARHRVEGPDDLESVPCAAWRSIGPPTWQVGEASVVLDPVLTTNDYEHLLDLALRGSVITELPPFLAHAPLMSGELVEVLPAHPMPRQTVRALVVETRLLAPVVRRFLDYVVETVPSELDPYAAT